MAKRNEKNNKDENNRNRKANKPINEALSGNEFKMPSSSGDGGNDENSVKPEGTSKLPQRKEPGFSDPQDDGSFLGNTSNDSSDDERSVRLEGEQKQNIPGEIKGPRGGASKRRPATKGIQKEPAKGKRQNTAVNNNANQQKNDPRKIVAEIKNGGDKKPTKDSEGASRRKAATTSKPSEKSARQKIEEIKNRDQKNFQSGPEGKAGDTSEVSRTDSEEKKSPESFTEFAKSTFMGFVDKMLPDEETQKDLMDTAREMLPDKENIRHSTKELKNQLSPEIEQVKKMVDKVIPEEEIREKTEKISATAKRIKNRNQEKAAAKKFEEISLISEYDIHLFKEGKHFHLYKKLGSHPMEFNGISGVYFALWAPNAKNVSVIGDFNHWNKNANPMKSRRDDSGIWEIFIPEAKNGSIYKYFIQSTNGYEAEKGDPFAFFWEVPPNTASVVWDLKSSWNDQKWMTDRKNTAGQAKPVSAYELHVGSWKRVPEEGNRSLTYRELAEQLPDYIRELGFTHVEFMPVMEHPFFGSWGYQVTGYFAPSSRFGTPQDFMHLIDALHQAGIGVILDWVPSHFPSDLHGLHYFDGTFLYEHEDRRKGFHPDWKSYIFNFGRNEVRSFLISSSLFWLDEFHVDGLRVDAVASMLYLDYSRKDGEWEPNEHGGNENLEAISFLKEFNEVVYAQFPDTITIAEESTAWPMVSKPTYMGGLGFGMKWMMGWMHDTLEYFKKDPIHRKHHQNTITFSTTYAFTENFMLPLSHDEVVYGKGSLLTKMPGDHWNKFANLRSLYAYMFAHPGTKLLFMGGEFGQTTEWDHDSSLHWHLTEDENHKKLQHTVSALNELYKTEPALYEKAFDHEGFEWVDIQDSENSVISFLRKGNEPKDTVLVVCNLTPVPRENYRIGVPAAGEWREIFNSDDNRFGGSDVKNTNTISADKLLTHGKEYSVSLTLPPMGVIYLKR